jgi:peptidoglycan hydrolase-like protein with peptidoglycan-binding domain
MAKMGRRTKYRGAPQRRKRWGSALDREPDRSLTDQIDYGRSANNIVDKLSTSSLHTQSAWLRDACLRSAQSQSLISQISKLLGNRHLQTVLGLGRRFAIVQRQGIPTAPPLAGTSLHPTIRYGSRGPAVEELQQKLNQAGATPTLAVDGIFGPLTRTAVVAFQRAQGLEPDGIVGPLTWGRMDEMGLTSSVGRVERQWEEQVGGQIYGMTSRYTWRITTREIRVTVRLHFTGVGNPGLVAEMFDHIRSTWNRFRAVNADTGESLAIVFDPQSVTSGADNVVRLRRGNRRSDTANWYIGDPDIMGTAAHEFGHMVGLEDEYQRSHRDYTRLTGEEPPEGVTENEADAADVARELHEALLVGDRDERVAQARGVIRRYGLAQGDYAQEVARQYQTDYGVDVITDIVNRIPDEDEFTIVDPFTYSTGSIMGTGVNHEHPVEARHVREFVQYVQARLGGTWRAEPL